jgi:hypothetical protein
MNRLCRKPFGSPGEVIHLPFTWPEDPKETKWHPPEISPILKMYRDKKGKGATDE